MRQRWEDWVNLVIGVWLFVSPWILGFTGETAAAWNAYLLGIATVVFTAFALYMPRRWEEWANSIIGLWMVLSPWLLGYAAVTGATWNAVVAGILLLGISLEATRSSRQIKTQTQS